MSTFFLTEEQFQAAHSRRRGPGRRRRRNLWLPPILGAIGAAALIVVQVLLGQYVGAGILAALLLALLVPPLIRARGRRQKVQERTRRLTSILYRIEVDETALELEYDQSIFRMSFENLLITKRNPDFYLLYHELGLMASVPLFALSPDEQKILDRHVTAGSFDWAAKNARGNRER